MSGTCRHPCGAQNDAARRRKLAAQPKLSFNNFRKLFRIRIQGEEARNECVIADLVRLQHIGKDVAHFSHMFLRMIPTLSRFVAA